MADLLRRDFLGPYIGAAAVATRQTLYNFAVQRSLMEAAVSPLNRPTLVPFVFPGYVAVALSPLGLMRYSTAFFVWAGINVCMSFWMALRLGKKFGTSQTEKVAIAVSVLASTPLLLTIMQGQLAMPVALGITEALIALREGRAVRAGLWLSLGLFKPQLIALPLISLVAARCWRLLFPFCIVMAATLCISFAVEGVWIVSYVTFLLKYPYMGAALARSYPSAMQNWLGAMVVSLGNHSLAYFLAMILSVSAILISILVCSSRQKRLYVRLALAVLLGVLACPHLYMHDLVIAIPAGVVLWSRRHEVGSVFTYLVILEPLISLIGQVIPPSGIQWMPWYIAVVVTLAVYRMYTPTGVLGLHPPNGGLSNA